MIYMTNKMNLLRRVKRAFRERLLWMCLCGMSGLMLVSCYESDEMNVDPIHAVDLGLSVEWAWCNMGANRPKETGSSCAWGEIAPKSYSWSANKDDYQYYNATTGSFKYLGTNISGTSYDAAHTTLGDGWRMPTKEEMQELIDECTWEWVQLFENDYSVDDSEFSYQEGFLVTGPNGNQIFFPVGQYWSGTNASFGAADPTSYILSASNGDAAAIKSELCYYAKYIRPVKGEMKSTEDEEETSASLGKTYTVNGVSFKMIGIEKGSFTMGATGEQSYSVAQSDERPTHQVILSDYAIGETEVTQALWQAVMGSNPSGFTGNLQRPVEGVSWYDCQNFIYKLNQLTGENFRLPTEAEWEYAARGGFNSKRYVYSGSDYVHDVAWYWSNSEYSTYPVKRKQANELRIYDMSGNVSEWCYDWYGSYSSATQTDPIGALEIGSTKTKVIRGGGYNREGAYCRVSSRSHLEPILSGHIGLRLAKSKSNVGVPTQQVCSVTTGEALDITDSGATIQGTVNDTEEAVTCGVIYGTTDYLDATNGTMVTTTAKGDYSVELTGLEPNTCYYYRTFVFVDGEYRYGDTTKFETTQTITIDGVSDITDSGATLYGVAAAPQGRVCGIMYGTTADLSATNGTTVEVTEQGDYSVALTGLEAGTTYYYCSYWITDEGEYRYGEVGSFVTLPKKTIYTVGGVSFTMIDVEGGTFTMGSSDSDSDAYDSEMPAHQVTLSSYAIGETEVTQALWQAVMGSNPSSFTGDLQRPVENVTWDNCQTFISKLNDLTGENFRLPTEAEWEYAARGGNASQGYKYSGSNTIGDVAWYSSNSSSKTHVVKTMQPNELGIYDMSGNVFEWCADWHGSYSSSAQIDPTGPSSGSNRVLRGGSWSSGYVRYCRVAYRSKLGANSRRIDIGLRLAR